MNKMGKLCLGSLVLQGFSYHTAKEYVQIRGDVNEKRARQVMQLLPFDVTFDKMFQDLLTTRRVLWEERDSFPAFYALTAKRDGQPVIFPLEDAGTRGKMSPETLKRLLYRVGGLYLRPGYNALRGKVDRLEVRNGSVFFNEKEMDSEWLQRYWEQLPGDTLLLQGDLPSQNVVSCYGCRCPVLHAVFVREQGRPVMAECSITDHADSNGTWRLYSTQQRVQLPAEDDAEVAAAVAAAQRVSQKFPEAPYLDVGLLLSEQGPKIWQIDTGKELIWRTKDSALVQTFLARQASQKKKDYHIVSRLRKYLFSMYAQRKGFLDYMYRNWRRGLKEDRLVETTTRQEKRWAHQRGFYSYRIKQYGLTEENYRGMLSDYDYKRLRPINGKYQKWLWDKVFMYYVLAPYQAYLPRHYFRILPEEGENLILPFAPMTEEEATVEGIEKLLREQGKLVLKQAVGSHGKGFYKLEWQAETQQIMLNDVPYTSEEFHTFLMELDKPCFISEFVQMHPEIRAIYDNVVNTVRLMVIDMGDGPQIQSSFFRIGVSSGGYTDNLDTGGIVARVDIASGRFGRTEMLKNHSYTPCSIHPDSGAPLEGVLPHWEMICRVVKEIAAYLTPMEYFGFDVVITADGFRILEVNTHQDLHRYPEYPQEVKDYFTRKCIMKERARHG